MFAVTDATPDAGDSSDLSSLRHETRYLKVYLSAFGSSEAADARTALTEDGAESVELKAI